MTPKKRRVTVKARSQPTLIRAKRQMRELVSGYLLVDPVKARVAQAVEATLLYAIGYQIDLPEEVDAFTDLILKETSRASR